MYELKNGAKRLAQALADISASPSRMEQLASLLYYVPGEQIWQDIQALNDYIASLEEQTD